MKSSPKNRLQSLWLFSCLNKIDDRGFILDSFLTHWTINDSSLQSNKLDKLITSKLLRLGTSHTLPSKNFIEGTNLIKNDLSSEIFLNVEINEKSSNSRR